MKTKINVLLNLCWAFPALIFFAPSVHAQEACRNVGDPAANSVCYTEFPFSARQRDEGGTRMHEFIVERVLPNSVIVDYEVLMGDPTFGAFSQPTGSILSSSGNAEIIETTRRETEQLNEVKNQLQIKANGCVGPVCVEVKNQLDAVNRQIVTLTELKETAVKAGGNDKINFKYTTSVDCNFVLGFKICGPGASVNGKVRVYQKYLGDPDSLKQASQSEVEKSRSLIKKIDGGVTTPQPSSQARTCKPGYVWREASTSDYVCVTGATREQTRNDNALAAERRSPDGGAYGPDTCKFGYVWREAFPGDRVCTTGDVRSQAQADNQEAENRVFKP
jgi:hypothetical protein